ncbi:ASH1 Transcriptional regulatory protein ASH1 [Candida maltosa Xu316]
MRSRSFELCQEVKVLRVNNCKRSYSDDFQNINNSKRARTAPPSPPYEATNPPIASNRLVIKNLVKPTNTLRSRSLSPNKKFTTNPLSPSSSPIATTTSPITSPQATRIKLPSISDALNLAPVTPKAPIKLKPIVPTVSLDYFDTYKPTDENWRYGLLDKIAKESKHFHLNQYNYLNDHAKPNFDSKLSSKIQHPQLAANGKKINFPYESNYTYLNKTYLNDVKNYPEYLELAVQLPVQQQQPQQQQQQQQQQQAPQPPSQSQQQQQPSLSATPIIPQLAPYTFLHNSNIPNISSYHQQTPPPSQMSTNTHKFIPLTPPSVKKSRSDLLKSPPRHSHHHHHAPRVCISCGSDQSPCWRPSWSIKEGQLCNSCGLRYKKTKARCLNDKCKKIPAKGEWTLMQSKGTETFEDGIEGYSCIACGWRVEVLPKS